MPRVVPASWMPDVNMERIHLHWTAGAHSANAGEKNSYHILIESDGTLVRGNKSIAENARPMSSNYARHTRGANTGAIGVSLCCMLGAERSPFDPGNYPMTRTQWDQGMLVVADLAEKYNILVTPTKILTHAEVEPNLNVPQNGKWDIVRLAFDLSVKGYDEVGQLLRSSVAAALDDGPLIAADAMPEDAKAPRYRVTGVAPSTLNLRRTPGGEKIGALPERTTVERLGVDGEWWRVRTRQGYIGYVFSTYLKAINP